MTKKWGKMLRVAVTAAELMGLATLQIAVLHHEPSSLDIVMEMGREDIHQFEAPVLRAADSIGRAAQQARKDIATALPPVRSSRCPARRFFGGKPKLPAAA